MNRPPRRLIAIAVLAVALTGCQNPYAGNHSVPATRRAPQRPAGRPGASATAIAPTSRSGTKSAQRVAEAFAVRWANWDWRSAADQQRSLARLATGALARDLRANAASTRINAGLARDKPGSRGTVAAINLTTGPTRATGIVVTREQSYTGRHADLGGRHYRVYRVRLHHEDNRWTVSTWVPQP